MKYIKADLVNDVVSSYDQTKTTIQGRVASKVINSQTVLGPPLTKFIDVFVDTGLPPASVYCTDNGRLFCTATPVNGAAYDTMPIMLYDFDLTTGAYAYVGRIDIQLPNLAASVHTFRAIKVIDTGTTGWKIFIATTASVTINGGLFMVNNIDKADFVQIGFPIIPMATASNAKAVYFLQGPANIGVGQLNIQSVGAVLDPGANRIYVHNGVSATHQYYVYDTAIAPTWTSNAVTGTEATNTINDAGHTFVNNTPVIFSSITGGAGLVANQPYFVVGAVAGVSYQLSTTSGGAAINFTTDITDGTIGRAWGTTGSNFIHKTGNLPSLGGSAILGNDSEDRAVPVASPINGGVLNGNPCAFFATSTAFFLGLLSELTSGAVTWPSLSTSNILGSINQITIPSAAFAAWSDVLDVGTYVTNSSKFISKQLENNNIRHITGELNNQYYETFNPETVNLGLTGLAGMDHAAGWLFAAGITTAAGQRGVIAADYRSDHYYDYSYIVTKVLNNPNGALKFITSYEQLWQDTGNIMVQYRTSGFGSISGGWIDLDGYSDLSASVITSDQIQFKICFGIQSEGSSSPAQINELLIGLEANNSISDNWEFSDDFSDNNTPSRCAFRLKQAYSSTVPQLFFRAYDLSDALLINNNTVVNAANFEYSTDNGLTWLPLGTIPNTVGTLLRYSFTSPPGVDIRPGLKES
jgi:hypothetical protein